MIRPFTLLCGVFAAGTMLYLYQTKHQAQVLDRQIAVTLKAADETKARIGMLRAEYQLLNDPTRLQDLSDKYLSLRPTAPGQFTQATEIARRLPDVDLTPPAPPIEEPAADLFVPAAAPIPVAAVVAPAPAKPAVPLPRPAPPVAVAAPTKPAPAVAANAAPPTILAASSIQATPLAARPAQPAVAAAPRAVAAQPRPQLQAVSTAPAQPTAAPAPAYYSALGMARNLTPLPARTTDAAGLR